MKTPDGAATDRFLHTVCLDFHFYRLWLKCCVAVLHLAYFMMFLRMHMMFVIYSSLWLNRFLKERFPNVDSKVPLEMVCLSLAWTKTAVNSKDAKHMKKMEVEHFAGLFFSFFLMASFFKFSGRILLTWSELGCILWRLCTHSWRKKYK